MYRLLWYEHEYQHGIKNPNTVLLLQPSSPEIYRKFSFKYDLQKLHYISGQSDIYRVTAAVCQTSCPPQQQEQGLPAAVPGLATTDAKLHCWCCCCWCCGPVLLLLWFGHTHAHKNCASDLWVEGIQTTSRDTPAGCAASRP